LLTHQALEQTRSVLKPVAPFYIWAKRWRAYVRTPVSTIFLHHFCLVNPSYKGLIQCLKTVTRNKISSQQGAHTVNRFYNKWFTIQEGD
jgi:hypothetical protein